jgi:hypothetical protein
MPETFEHKAGWHHHQLAWATPYPVNPARPLGLELTIRPVLPLHTV